jgi:hypothetical protein
MSQLPADEGIIRFKANEERMDVWLNSDGTYSTNETSPRTVETIPSLMDRLQTRYLQGVVRGEWQTSTLYAINDIVTSSNIAYITIEPHTSGTFATDLAANKWVIFQATNSQLIDFLQDGTDAVSRKLDKKLYEIVSVEDFGAVGDGTTDDLTAIQAAVDSLTEGGILNFNSDAYEVSGVINVNGKNITFNFTKRGTMTWTALGTGKPNSYNPTTAGISVDANRFTILNAILVGPHTASYVDNSCMIQMIGTDKDTRLEGLIVSNCEISKVGSYGIYGQYLNNILLENVYIHNVGYAGANFDSCDNGAIVRAKVETITPGTSSNMYGLSLGMYAPTGWDNTSAYDPMCKHWIIKDSYINDTAWEGIDVHGADNVIICNNKVYNTKQGLGISTNSNGTINDRFGGPNVLIFGNVVDGRNPDGTASGRENLQYGINVNGGGALSATNVKVLNNIILYKGVVDESNPEAGALQCAYCDGLEVAGNTIDYWGGTAIAWDKSTNVLFGYNEIGRLVDPTNESAGYGFNATSAVDSKVMAIGNSCLSKGGATAKIAWRQQNNVQRPVFVGNDFSQATTKFSLDVIGFQAGLQEPQLIAVTSDTTPSVAGLFSCVPIIIEISNASGLTITNIDDGTRGQIVILKNIGSGNVTFTRANARLLASASWVGTTYESLTLIKASTGEWHEVSRSGALG